jgi:hypothetical protein
MYHFESPSIFAFLNIILSFFVHDGVNNSTMSHKVVPLGVEFQ